MTLCFYLEVFDFNVNNLKPSLIINNKIIYNYKRNKIFKLKSFILFLTFTLYIKEIKKKSNLVYIDYTKYKNRFIIYNHNIVSLLMKA